MAKDSQVQEIKEVKKTVLSIPASILLGSVLISLSILLGTGVIRVKGVSTNAGLGAVPTASTAPVFDPNQPVPTEDPGPFEVSVDDDPVLGNANAPVTLIEFSDYECPFCKRYYTDTYPQIIKDYVDTGKVKIVFRDLPLSFHDPMATNEAIAANCAREQGGDAAYFKMHDIIFEKTTSNGNGLTVDQLPTLATEAGLNGQALKTCFDSGKFKDEVAKDLADAGAVGASGTPTFFVGKSSDDGKITAMRLVGAQPYAAFKTLIDQMIAQ